MNSPKSRASSVSSSGMDNVLDCGQTNSAQVFAELDASSTPLRDSEPESYPHNANSGSNAPQISSPPVPDQPFGPRDLFEDPLQENLRKEITSKLLDPIIITFDQPEELLRAQKPTIPRKFYRTFHETSATLSKYVSIDTHVKHRKRKDLKIEEGVAFQTVAEFILAKFLHLEGIELHLVWNQRRKPSGYISVFDSLGPAERRAYFHYDESQRIGQRVSIARISTDGLIPATVRAKCKTEVGIYPKRGPLRSHLIAVRTFDFDVMIPVWIRKTAKEQFGSTLTQEQLDESGADIWLSITEIRNSNLREGPSRSSKRNVVCAKGHDYEWLACGKIPDWLVEGVFPWDGKELHFNPPGYPIRSVENSGQPWVWGWPKRMWIPDRVESSAVNAQDQTTSKKRKHDGAIMNRELPKPPPTPLSFSCIMSVETTPLPPASELEA